MKNFVALHLEIFEILENEQIIWTQKAQPDWWLMREKYQESSYVGGEQRKTG